MRLLFKNRYDEEREIGTPKTNEETMTMISEFLKEHNFTSYYMRFWKEMKDGKSKYVFDVGSHIEFFILEGDIELFEEGLED